MTSKGNFPDIARWGIKGIDNFATLQAAHRA